MKIGDTLICIKDYIDLDSDFDVKYQKNKPYTICMLDDDHVGIKGDVDYHIQSPSYLCHGFSLNYENKKTYPDDIYLKDYFLSITKYRKQKLKKLNGSM